MSRTEEIYKDMEEKLYDEGVLTFEDRYPFPPYKHSDTDLEDELAWAQVEEKVCAKTVSCGLGWAGSQHGILCPMFDWQEDTSNATHE